MLFISDYTDDIVNDPRGIAIINALFGATNPQVDFQHPRTVTQDFINRIPAFLYIVNHTLVNQQNQPVRPIEAAMDPRLSPSEHIIKLISAQQNFHFHSYFDQDPNSWLIHILNILRFILDWHDYGAQSAIRIGVNSYRIIQPRSQIFFERPTSLAFNH